MNVYIICPVLVSVALLGISSQAASPPIFLPDVYIMAGFCPNDVVYF